MTSRRVRPPALLAKIAATVDYDRPSSTRNEIEAYAGIGFTHFVLSLPAPYPAGAARWLADEIIQAAAT